MPVISNLREALAALIIALAMAGCATTESPPAYRPLTASEGRALAAQGRYFEACAKLEESERILRAGLQQRATHLGEAAVAHIAHWRRAVLVVEVLVERAPGDARF